MIAKRTTTVLLVIAIMIIVLRSAKAAGNVSLFDLFIQAISKTFGILSSIQSDSVINILNAFNEYGDGDSNKLAYIFATAYHESKFIPQKENRCTPGTKCYKAQEKYWYTGYYGRGLVQITLESNYKTMGDVFNVDLINNPDLVLNTELSAKILVYGMINGIFAPSAGRLDRYINSSKVDFINARKTVNGTDRAADIAEYASAIVNNINLLTQPV